MHRRTSSIPNEASLTAFEILALTLEQYNPKKRAHHPTPATAGGGNGNGKIKSAKPSRKPARSAKKS